MNELVNAYSPWVLTAFRIESVLVQPWIVGYKYNPTYQHPWPYLDVDASGSVAALVRANGDNGPDRRNHNEASVANWTATDSR